MQLLRKYPVVNKFMATFIKEERRQRLSNGDPSAEDDSTVVPCLVNAGGCKRRTLSSKGTAGSCYLCRAILAKLAVDVAILRGRCEEHEQKTTKREAG